MLTPAHVAADLAADRTRTLLAEAEAHRLAHRALARRDPTPTGRWSWARLSVRITAPAPGNGNA